MKNWIFAVGLMFAVTPALAAKAEYARWIVDWSKKNNDETIVMMCDDTYYQGVDMIIPGREDGAATQAGTFSFDVTVTDQRKRAATKRYSIVVAEGPSIQIDGTVPDGVDGRAVFGPIFTLREAGRRSAGRSPANCRRG